MSVVNQKINMNNIQIDAKDPPAQGTSGSPTMALALRIQQKVFDLKNETFKIDIETSRFLAQEHGSPRETSGRENKSGGLINPA